MSYFSDRCQMSKITKGCKYVSNISKKYELYVMCQKVSNVHSQITICLYEVQVYVLSNCVYMA